MSSSEKIAKYVQKLGCFSSSSGPAVIDVEQRGSEMFLARAAAEAEFNGVATTYTCARRDPSTL